MGVEKWVEGARTRVSSRNSRISETGADAAHGDDHHPRTHHGDDDLEDDLWRFVHDEIDDAREHLLRTDSRLQLGADREMRRQALKCEEEQQGRR
jgi:hypothetical protein